jgi:hypothetical protein
MRSELKPTHRLINKTCSKCKASKPVSEFNFRNTASGARQSYCKECGKGFTRSHYRNNKRQYLDRNVRSYMKRRELVRQMKSRACADCGVQYPFYVMDFDHREGEIKEYELNRIDRMTIQAILREIKKCDVVCANCHRVRTYQRRIKQAEDHTPYI